MSSTRVTADRAAAPARTAALPAVAAILLGLVFVFAVGFSPIEAAHNAAHDTRHAFSFPCH